MLKEKKSFFEKLTGARSIKNKNDNVKIDTTEEQRKDVSNWIEEENDNNGELTVDVYQNPNSIIIKTITAGVRPDDLEISITRDMVTIQGERQTSHEINEEDYFSRELYWGSFSRTVLLPEEIDVEGAEANEKHGLLTITLPKLDKHRETKLKVKAT